MPKSHSADEAEDPGLKELLAKRDAAIEQNRLNAAAYFEDEEKRTKAQAAMAKKSTANRGA